MDSNAIPVNENTTVIVKASGDLFLSGDESTSVKFMSSEDRIRINQTNDTLYVETHASMDLVVPRTAKVIVEKVGGSAFMQDIEGDLVVQKIGGDLAVRRLRNVRIEKVGGGCLVEGIGDALAIHKIGGDLTLREAAGAVAINSVGGDCDIQAMGNGPAACRAGGDLRLYITETLSEPVSVAASGDMWLYLPSNLSASFRLDSGGEIKELNLSGQSQEIERRHYEFTVGEGGPVVEARAGGDIRISDETAEPGSITAELDRRENAWKDAREHQGIPSWSGGFGFDRTSAWADMISRRAQEASRRAEQRAQSAMRRTEEQIRAAAERELHQPGRDPRGVEFGRRWGGPPTPPTPPQPPSEPVTESERMMVLKMLQEGKLTIEQADQLLAALEGRYNR